VGREEERVNQRTRDNNGKLKGWWNHKKRREKAKEENTSGMGTRREWGGQNWGGHRKRGVRGWGNQKYVHRLSVCMKKKNGGCGVEESINTCC